METQILRVSKRKSLVELRKCGRHNARTAPVSNAIESKKHENILEGPSDLVPEFKRCTEGMTVRKNAVYAIEILATFSASAADRIDSEQFFRDSQRWVVTHFGGEKNLIQSALHRDEKTPHCHFVVVPVDGRNLKLPILWVASLPSAIAKTHFRWWLKIMGRSRKNRINVATFRLVNISRRSN